jgi:hypothetical protein
MELDFVGRQVVEEPDIAGDMSEDWDMLAVFALPEAVAVVLHLLFPFLLEQAGDPIRYRHF